MTRKYYYLALITIALAALSALLLFAVGLNNIWLFVLVAILCIDAICLPWAFCYRIELHLNGETSFLDRFPLHSGYVLFFFISPYVAFLFVKEQIKNRKK